MAIVNAVDALYEDIPSDLLEHVEDIIFDRRPIMTDYGVVWRRGRRDEEGARSLVARGPGRGAPQARAVHGIDEFIEEDTEEARTGRTIARWTSSRDR